MADWSVVPGLSLAASGGINASTQQGTLVYAPGSAHTKGSWTEIWSSLPFDAAVLAVCVERAAGGAGFLMDIGIGPDSGSVEIIIPDYFHWSAYTMHGAHTAHLSLAVPSESKLWARCQCGTAGHQVAVSFRAHAPAFAPSSPLGRALMFGADSANSRGTVIDPGATAGQKGDWIEIAAAADVEHDVRELHVLASRGSSISSNAGFFFDIGIGASGSQEVYIPNLKFHGCGTFVHFSPTHIGPIPVFIPAGTRIWGRGCCDTTSEEYRKFDVTLLGLS